MREEEDFSPVDMAGVVDGPRNVRDKGWMAYGDIEQEFWCGRYSARKDNWYATNPEATEEMAHTGVMKYLNTLAGDEPAKESLRAWSEKHEGMRLLQLMQGKAQ